MGHGKVSCSLGFLPACKLCATFSDWDQQYYMGFWHVLLYHKAISITLYIRYKTEDTLRLNNDKSTHPDFFQFPRVSQKNFIHISAGLHHFFAACLGNRILDISLEYSGHDPYYIVLMFRSFHKTDRRQTFYLYFWSSPSQME